jgi:hypothetical protein
LEDVAAEPDSTEEDLPEVGGRIEAGEDLEAPEEGNGEDSRS